MTRYATAFKGLRIVTLRKKNRKIQDALKSIRNGKLCSTLNTYASEMIKRADIVLLAYNSAGEVRGVAGVDEFDDHLYVTIICNDMAKRDRREGYAPGKGLLDLLKKIAVKKRKDLTLSSVNNTLNYYKRFGFRQDPESNSKTSLRWSWRPYYSRPRRFEYESVNSNYNSNSSNRSVSSNSNSNRSSATVKISPTQKVKKNIAVRKNTLKRTSTLPRHRAQKRIVTSLKRKKSKLKDEIREKRLKNRI